MMNLPAEQANDNKLSPSSVGSWTLLPSSSNLRTAAMSPSMQASTKLREPENKNKV